MTDDPRFLIDEVDYWSEMDAAKEVPDVSAPACARCNGCGRVEVNTIMGRMLDACPDCAQPNEFF